MMQAMGNTYYAYINIEDFSMWSELFGLIEEDVIFQKRILAIISGAILPLVALGFIKSLVDYIKPESNPEEFIRNENIDESSYDENQDLYYSIQEEMRNDKTGEPKEIESDERDLAQPANISIENANSNRARGVEINPANLR
jgi:hypothetical protein